jgi:hypothetical protein
MEIRNIAPNIVKILKEKYKILVRDECMDLSQIINICTMYKTKTTDTELSLCDIQFSSSPEFVKVNPKTHKKKNHEEILQSTEFKQKYDFFIRIIFSCLKMDIEIFDMADNFATLKNNYKLIKSMEHRKKKLIEGHFLILKEQYRNITKKLDIEYETYVSEYILKIKIIDKMIGSVNRLIQTEVFEKTDNLFSLVIPYFYNYVRIIEEYN